MAQGSLQRGSAKPFASILLHYTVFMIILAAELCSRCSCAQSVSTVVTDEVGLFKAFLNSTVTRIVIPQNMKLQQEFWANTWDVVNVTRDLLVEGPTSNWTSFPEVDFSFISGKVVLSPGVTLTFRRLALLNLFSRIKPQYDFFATSPNTSTIVWRQVVDHLILCMPLDFAVNAWSAAPRPADASGLYGGQQQSVTLRTSPPYCNDGMGRCFSPFMDAADMVTYGTAGYRIAWSEVDTICDGFVTQDCIDSLGPDLCYATRLQELLAQRALIQKNLTSGSSSKKAGPTAVIAGCVVAGVMALASAVLIPTLLLRRRRRQRLGRQGGKGGAEGGLYGKGNPLDPQPPPPPSPPPPLSSATGNHSCFSTKNAPQGANPQAFPPLGLSTASSLSYLSTNPSGCGIGDVSQEVVMEVIQEEEKQHQQQEQQQQERHATMAAVAAAVGANQSLAGPAFPGGGGSGRLRVYDIPGRRSYDNAGEGSERRRIVAAGGSGNGVDDSGSLLYDSNPGGGGTANGSPPLAFPAPAAPNVRASAVASCAAVASTTAIAMSRSSSITASISAPLTSLVKSLALRASALGRSRSSQQRSQTGSSYNDSVSTPSHTAAGVMTSRYTTTSNNVSSYGRRYGSARDVGGDTGGVVAAATADAEGSCCSAPTVAIGMAAAAAPSPHSLPNRQLNEPNCQPQHHIVSRGLGGKPGAEQLYTSPAAAVNSDMQNSGIVSHGDFASSMGNGGGGVIEAAATATSAVQRQHHQQQQLQLRRAHDRESLLLDVLLHNKVSVSGGGGSSGAAITAATAVAASDGGAGRCDVSGSGGIGYGSGDLEGAAAVAAAVAAVGSEVLLGPLIGSGSYGKVYRGSWRGSCVAVKVISHNRHNTLGSIANELRLSLSFEHRNVVRAMSYMTCSVDEDGKPTITVQSRDATTAIRQQGDGYGNDGCTAGAGDDGCRTISTLAYDSEEDDEGAAGGVRGDGRGGGGGGDMLAALYDADALAEAGTGGGGGRISREQQQVRDVAETWVIQEFMGRGTLSQFIKGGGMRTPASGPNSASRRPQPMSPSFAPPPPPPPPPPPLQPPSNGPATAAAAAAPPSSDSRRLHPIPPIPLPTTTSTTTLGANSPTATPLGYPTSTTTAVNGNTNGIFNNIGSGRNVLTTGASSSTINMMNVVHCALDIARGLQYLHGCNVCHGDLKPGNILLAEDPGSPWGFVAKLADFGLSRALAADRTHLTTKTLGTVSYMCPVVLSTGRVSPASCVYSYGIILWELVSGRPPYAGCMPGLIIKRVLLEDQRPDFNFDDVVKASGGGDVGGAQPLPEWYGNLARRCWHRDPVERPSMAEVVSELELRAVQLTTLGLS
ncbi:hypothetical protein Agub_g7510 [Astrephomene gubernaculifera]|uniref:Protein kinase domain-containing protein n=1 Tax=Astrephomene gubernaculifera TaxID=47775 RepID=A0AAD3HMH7_9CHLO|nr:hypothetical protein Agub_g7510 [Astrephomene gubernaculifera]